MAPASATRQTPATPHREHTSPLPLYAGPLSHRESCTAWALVLLLPWALLPARSPLLSPRCTPVEGLHFFGRLLSPDSTGAPNHGDTAVFIHLVFAVIKVNYTHSFFLCCFHSQRAIEAFLAITSNFQWREIMESHYSHRKRW